MAVCLWAGCQPYIDQVDDSTEFRAGFVDFGVRRDLKLVESHGDSESLLLVFNQPLQEFSQAGQAAPFEPSFYPRIPVKSVLREGVAGVRVHFSETLPLAQTYSVEIPRGWRALSGATFLQDMKVTWTTERPDLDSLSTGSGLQDWTPGTPLILRFNMPVDLDSLNERLRVTRAGVDEPLQPSLIELSSLSGSETDYQLMLSPQLPVGRYALQIEEGYRPRRGRLEGLKSRPFDFGPRETFRLTSPAAISLPPDGSVTLSFERTVSSPELRRHLAEVDWDRAWLESSDQKTFRLRGLDPDLRMLTITRGLVSEDGGVLRPPYRVALNRAGQARASRPLSLRLHALAPGAMVWNRKVDQDTEISTWELSEQDLVKLLTAKATDEARLYQKVEAGKPVYRAVQAKAQKNFRFLGEQKPARPPHGAFLVRLQPKPGAAQRILLMRTRLPLKSAYLNDVVMASSYPSRSRVTLYSREGSRLSQHLTDDRGDITFSLKPGTTPALLVARQGGQYQVQVLTRQTLNSPRAPQGLLWTESASAEPGGAVEFFGVWWGDGESPTVSLRDRQGRLMEQQPTLDRSGRLFRGVLTAPRQHGRYALSLDTGAKESPSTLFEVTDLSPDLSPSTLNLESAEGGGYRGSYSWEGPGASRVRLRVRLMAARNLVDGWSFQKPGVPRWIPVDVNLKQESGGAEFTIDSIPLMEAPHSLQAELYDADDPSLIYRRVSLDLTSQPLELARAASRLGAQGEQIVTFLFQARDKPEAGKTFHCRLQTLKGREWVNLEDGIAEPAEGGANRLEWTATLKESGRVRLMVETGEGEAREPLGTWEKSIARSGIRWSPLAVSADRVKPGDRLTVSWPGKERAPVAWIGFMVDDRLLPVRSVTMRPDGSLGTLTVPALSPGVGEFTLWACVTDVGGVPHYRRARLQARDEEIVTSLPNRIDGRDDLAACQADQRLALSFPDGGGRRVLVWWEPSGEESGQVSDSPWRALLGRTRAARPLHFQGERTWVEGPTDLVGDQINIQAPSVPGRYTLHVLTESEQLLRFSERSLEVKPGARWDIKAPRFVRPGDKFFAGIRFSADPEAASPTGATISVNLNSALRPSTYYTTAGLVEAGSSKDMMFSYLAPDRFSTHSGEGFILEWELGVEGKAWPIGTTVGLRPNPARAKLYRSRELGPHSALRFNLAGRGDWRTDLHFPSDGSARLDTELEVKLGDQPAQQVKLDEQLQMVKLFQSGNGEVEVNSKNGAPVRVDVYQLLEEKVDRMATTVYLLTGREVDGKALAEKEPVQVDKEFRSVYSLVVPKSLAETWLVVPLPGNVRVLACTMIRGAESTPLKWELENGNLLADIPSLSKGEARIEVAMVAEVAGDYSWPSPTITSLDGTVSAGADASRLLAQ